MEATRIGEQGKYRGYKNKNVDFLCDTACGGLTYSDSRMILIGPITVRNEIADNLYGRSELND
ncbi:MAG: DUF6061 family protein [Faecousia sp.]